MDTLLLEKKVLHSEWKTAHPFWPVSDIDGNWLLFADVERRALASGEFEYRGVIEGM